jgi:hypothetical protein
MDPKVLGAGNKNSFFILLDLFYQQLSLFDNIQLDFL